MQRMPLFLTGISIIAVLWLPGSLVFSASINDINVVKISAGDQSAVIKIAGHKLQILKPGDKIGEGGVVLEIAADRIVIEEPGDLGKDLVIIYLENNKQRIERIKKIGEAVPPLYTPRDPVEQK